MMSAISWSIVVGPAAATQSQISGLRCGTWAPAQPLRTQEAARLGVQRAQRLHAVAAANLSADVEAARRGGQRVGRRAHLDHPKQMLRRLPDAHACQRREQRASAQHRKQRTFKSTRPRKGIGSMAV